LEAVFTEFGPVERVNVIRDRDTGQPRGFAFVEMTNSGDAANAINNLNGREMNGRTLNVNEARPREERGGGGNRFGGRPSGGRPRREPRW
jgi:RNA recognition motif-containing protein